MDCGGERQSLSLVIYPTVSLPGSSELLKSMSTLMSLVQLSGSQNKTNECGERILEN